MTSDHLSATLVILSSDIVKSPDQVQNQINKLSSESEVFHHQLLERISSAAIKLSSNFYSHIHISDKIGGNVILDENICDILFISAKDGCKLTGQIDTSDPKLALPLLLSGWIKEGHEFVKPKSVQVNNIASVSVSIKRGEKRGLVPKFKRLNASSTTSTSTSTSSSLSSAPSLSSPFSSIVKLNLDDDDDDLIDENDLMIDDDASLPPAIVLPAKCDPGPGRKRRKACKDCTCGLKELELQELESQQSQQQQVIKLASDDMAEIDFTIPGKAVGGCGSCALGDAFRCDGCPYLGLPPFKPGEVVSIAGIRGDDL